MATTQASKKNPAGRVTVDDARVDRLRELVIKTAPEVETERVKIMAEVYESTEGYQQIIRRAKFLAALLERKKLYIDDNLFVGSMGSKLNAIYTYPEWNVQWMKEEKTVEKSKTPEDRKANQWALDYWGQRSLAKRTLEIFEKKYGFDPNPAYDSGLIISFFDWPGGGGNLNYPRVYNEGLASMIKEVEERQKALEMRLPNAPKFYFYESGLIVMRAIIRLAHRYAELAREMAAKEKDPTRKEELLAIAETCEWVPEHPARNLREAIQSHFLCHICAELEQVGCGYSEAYLGQNFEPFYQRDKAAGLIGPDEAAYMLKHLFLKLNEINYYYGEKVLLQNSADLGQSISLGGFTEDGEDATAEMDYLILDAMKHLRMPQPPLTCVYTEKMSGRFLEKVLDVIDTGIGMPQFVNGDLMIKRALNLFGSSKKGITLEKARRTCIGACVGSYVPYETGHPVEGQPNLGKVLELTMNNGFDPRTKQQIGPKTGDPETFKDFEELYAAFAKQLQSCEDTLRRGAWIASMLCAEYLPVTWRSLLTGGCIETGTEVWNGGANYYTVAQIVVGGVDAANGLLAVKHLVYDTKKLTMAELRKALAADFEGEHEKVRRACFEAPKHGNDIPEVNRFVHRVYDTILQAFNNVDGGGNYVSRDIKSAPDAYTKSIHNLMGLQTGALPSGKKAGAALTDGSLSAMPGTDTHGPTALAMSAAKSCDAIKFTATHMNMKLPPNQLKSRKGRESVISIIKALADNDGYHVQFNVLNTDMLRDAQKNPEKYPDLVVRVAGFSAYWTRLHKGVQDEIIARTEQEFGTS
jgi:pyruvate formate-lyase/glycerol dehydratase family glycyl radical enzyme